MHRHSFILILVLGAMCVPAIAGAQAGPNPFFSAIGDMRYEYRDARAAELADVEDLGFVFREVEINIAGYLNPYARADVTIAVHGVEGPVGVEEAYATLLRGLPVQLKFGKYFLDFGRINQLHIHAMPWLEYPLMIRSFFGEEGARVIGLQANRLQGVGDTAVKLSLNAFRSDFFGRGEEHHEAEETGGDEEGHAHGGEGRAKLGASGRLTAYRDVGETSGLEVGASALYAVYDIDEDLQTINGGVDVQYKWFPDTYKGFKFIAEAMIGENDAVTDTLGTIETVTAYGAFTSAEVRFRQRWDVGAFVDWSQNALDADDARTALGGWVGFMPVEESIRFSLNYRYARESVEGNDDDLGSLVTFQVIFGLGPHKPHPF